MNIKRIKSENGDTYVRLATEGEITMRDVMGSIKNPLEALLGAEWSASKILLDMTGTHYIDSAAIAWLLQCQKELRKGGGVLVIHSIPQHVRQILDLLKIGKVVHLALDETSARAMLIGAH